MPTIQFVAKEDASGLIGGGDFGSRVRVLARSPTHVVFNALGGRLWTRPSNGASHHTDERTLFSARPTIAQWEAVKDKVDAVLGDGVGAAVVQAWRTHKTVLVNGGGRRMPLPHIQAVAIRRAAYDLIKPDREIDLTAELKRCKQCGAPLKPSTDHHRFGYGIAPNHPRSLEDCQQLTNQRVIACHGYGMGRDKWAGLVEWFESWDGESYQDPDFCNDACASKYGRRAVVELPPLESGTEPVRQAFRRRDDYKHGVPEPEFEFRLESGRSILERYEAKKLP